MPPENQMDTYIRALVKALGKLDNTTLLESINNKLTQVSVEAKGEKGDDGKDGTNGTDGRDGISVTNASVNGDGELLLLMSDGKEYNLGRVVGRDGQDAEFDEKELTDRILSMVPKLDEERLFQDFLNRLPKTEQVTAKELAEKIRKGKEISWEDLADKPDLPQIIKKYTAHLEHRQMGSGASALSMLLDVDLTGLQVGNTIVWNGTDWVAGAGGGGGSVETVVGDGSIEVDATDPANPIVSLVNDEDAPANSYYYGTNGSGTKGFHAFPAGGAVAFADLTGDPYDNAALTTALDDKADALTADQNYVTDAQLVVITNTSGTNSGDQTSIVGITGTKAQFNTAVTDGDFLFVGDITQYTDEMAQDAVGTILTDSAEIDFTYNDAGPTITASLIAGSIDETKLDASVNASLDLADSALQNITGLIDDGTNITITGTGTAGDPYVINATGGGSGVVETVVAGTGISVDATDPANPIVATTITQYTDEMAQDAVGNLVGAGLSYDDGTGVISSTITQYTDALARAAISVSDSSEIDFTYNSGTGVISGSLVASSIDESKLDASVNASLDLADSAVQDLADLGITATAAEINYTTNVTSDIQAQLDGKQPLDADLTIWAGLTPSANAQSLVTAANYAAMRALLDLEAGTDFLSPAAIAAAYQPLDADLTSWAGVTRAAGFDTFTATPSSANLAALVTGETGSGALVFATSPTLVTPALGTPSSGTLTNCTGLPVAGGGTGVATLTAYAPIFGGTTGTGAVQSGAVGNAGEVLTSNGAGALPTFQAAGGGAIDYQAFTASGTWNKPSGLTGDEMVFIQVWGGGGGGGQNTTSKYGGGGGGAYMETKLPLSSLGSSESVTVGAAVGGATAGNPSSFGSWITAYGGGAGSTGSNSAGGGGVFSAGSNAGSGTSFVGAGGAPLGGATAGIASNFGGGAGGAGNTTTKGGNSVYGGGGGGSAHTGGAGGAGGDSIYGGGGGGGGGTSAGAGGTSLMGGNGGAGSSSGAGTSGTAPAGGGGGAGGGSAAGGGGARGEVRVWVLTT